HERHEGMPHTRRRVSLVPPDPAAADALLEPPSIAIAVGHHGVLVPDNAVPQAFRQTRESPQLVYPYDVIPLEIDIRRGEPGCVPLRRSFFHPLARRCPEVMPRSPGIEGMP